MIIFLTVASPSSSVYRLMHWRYISPSIIWLTVFCSRLLFSNQWEWDSDFGCSYEGSFGICQWCMMGPWFKVQVQGLIGLAANKMSWALFSVIPWPRPPLFFLLLSKQGRFEYSSAIVDMCGVFFLFTGLIWWLDGAIRTFYTVVLKREPVNEQYYAISRYIACPQLLFLYSSHMLGLGKVLFGRQFNSFIYLRWIIPVPSW